jgi:exonuclease SbcC
MEEGGVKTLIDEVTLKNFRSHKNTVISFKYAQGENITVIVGDNGAGKTSILDGISFALFKWKPVGVTTDELITMGKKNAEVSITFHSNGRRYRVLRRRVAKGRSESFLYQLDEDQDKLIATKEKEVSQEIEDILGINGELFTNAVYIKQGEIDRLFTDDPAKRKKHVGNLIGIEDIESAYQNFFGLLNHFGSKIEKLSGVINELDEKKEAKKKETKEAKTLKLDLKGFEVRLDKEKNTLEDLEKRIEILEDLKIKTEEVKKLSIEISFLKDKVKKIMDFEMELRSTEEDKKRADEVEKEVDVLKEKANALKAVVERKSRVESELKVLINKVVSLEKEIVDILSRNSSILKTKVDDVKSFEKEKIKALRSIETKIKSLEGRKEETIKNISEERAFTDSLKKGLEEVSKAQGTCPVCNRTLTKAHRERLLNNYSKKIESLAKKIAINSEELQTLRADLEALERRRDSINSLNTDILREKKRQLDEGRNKITLLEKELKKDQSDLELLMSLTEKLDALKNELTTLSEARDSYNAARNFLRKELPEKENTEERIMALEEMIEGREREISLLSGEAELNLGSLPEVYERSRDSLRSSQQSLIALEREVASFRSSLKHKEARIMELKGEISSLSDKVRERKDLMGFKILLERIRSVFHKDKLQKELRIRARPLIEEYTREVFLSFNLAYSDVTLTDDYSILVHGANGEERVDMLSGGERIAAALALRVGLSRAIAGQRLELLILDEPTIHLDAQRRRELVEVIRRLSTIPQTIVVTHDKEFEEAADRIIEVEKIDGVSVVK